MEDLKSKIFSKENEYQFLDDKVLNKLPYQAKNIIITLKEFKGNFITTDNSKDSFKETTKIFNNIQYDTNNNDYNTKAVIAYSEIERDVESKPKDIHKIKESFELLITMSNNGVILATYFLARIFDFGYMPNRNISEEERVNTAEEYYIKVYNWYFLKNNILKDKNFIPIEKVLANLANINNMKNFKILFKFQEISTENFLKSFEYYKLLAELGDPFCLVQMGWYYSLIEKDLKTAGIVMQYAEILGENFSLRNKIRMMYIKYRKNECNFDDIEKSIHKAEISIKNHRVLEEQLLAISTDIYLREYCFFDGCRYNLLKSKKYYDRIIQNLKYSSNIFYYGYDEYIGTDKEKIFLDLFLLGNNFFDIYNNNLIMEKQKQSTEAKLLSYIGHQYLEILKLQKQVESTTDSILDQSEAENKIPPFPEVAPELYAKRPDREEKIIDFLKRVYGVWMEAGELYQDKLKHIDPQAYMALHNWCRKPGEDISKYALPKKDRLSKLIQSLPNDVIKNPLQTSHLLGVIKNRYRKPLKSNT